MDVELVGVYIREYYVQAMAGMCTRCSRNGNDERDLPVYRAWISGLDAGEMGGCLQVVSTTVVATSDSWRGELRTVMV